MSDIAFKSTCELAGMIRNREIKSEELLDYYLERTAKHNEALNAIVVFDTDRARIAARRADARLERGEPCGPLHGVPMTIKESYSVAGLPSTFGNPVYRDTLAERDALSVQRLKEAGAVLFGKTNVPLSLADFQSYNEVYGTTGNPWDPARTPGGSSGGSAAALAAGLVGFESGSDIGGSIRNPAHYCGVFGHKPTWNLLPPRGHALPGILAPSDLSVIGPLGRSAADLELGVRVMAGPDEIQGAGYRLQLREFSGRSLGDLKLAAWPDCDVAPVSRDVRQRVRKVARMVTDAGGSVDFDARPDLDPADHEDVYQSLLQATMASRKTDEEYNSLHADIAALDSGDDSTRALTLKRQTLSHRDYLKANERRTHFRWAWHEFFGRYDAMIAPIMATSAFPHDHGPFGKRTIDVDGHERPYFEQVFWSGLAIASYLPSTVIPTGPDARGLPIGIQIIGPEFGDLKTTGIARLLEEAGCGFQAPPGY